MPDAELFLLFVRPFNRAGIRYVIGGSVAAIFYGEPRLTNDVDFVAFLNATDIKKLPELFPPTNFCRSCAGTARTFQYHPFEHELQSGCLSHGKR
jgi:hypothetical protein